MSTWINKLKHIELEDIFNIIQFGMVKNSLSLFDLRNENFAQIEKPVFFLSTGRCGTKWFTKLLSSDASLKVFHNQHPEFLYQGKMCYELLKENQAKQHLPLLKEVFLTGREDLMLKCAQTNHRYVETNNRITFFAPVINEIFKDAIFIHVYRHPIQFITSGLNRRWYKGDPHDVARIESKDASWNNYSQLEKIAWLWNETNKFIDEFLDGIPDDRKYTLNFNQKNTQNIQELLNIIDVSVSEGKLDELMDKRVNSQKISTATEASSWSSAEKESVKNICGALADKFGYSF